MISVGALDANLQVADFSQFNSQVEIAAPGVAVLSTIPYLSINELAVDGGIISGYHITNSPYGNASGPLVDGGRCLSTGNWTDAIVLCERGDADFYDKVINVQNSGGMTAIIYNNEPGIFLGTLGDKNSSIIPAISISPIRHATTGSGGDKGHVSTASPLGRPRASICSEGDCADQCTNRTSFDRL